jgi:hypothetical protein
MHTGVGAIFGVIAGGAVGYFVIDTVSQGIPGQAQFETAAIAVNNRAVDQRQAAPSLRGPALQKRARREVGESAVPLPCYRWKPTGAGIASRGIGLQGDAVRGVYAASADRIWSAFSEPCRATLGLDSLTIIERMGLAPCVELVRAQGTPANVRALRAALTVEYSLFMRDLALAVGAAQAERLVSSDQLCFDQTALLAFAPR